MKVTISNLLQSGIKTIPSTKYHIQPTTYQRAFTIVELLVVIVVIGILAAITIVSYTGISNKATVSSLQSDLSSAKKQLALYYIDHSAYPTSLNGNSCPVLLGVTDTRYCLKQSSGNTFTYSPVIIVGSSPQSFTLVATNTSSSTKYIITNNSSPTAFSSNWIAGIAGTALENKWVYNADVSGNPNWGPYPSTLASPQGATGLDTTPYDTYMAFVADNNVDFSAYPARQACKVIGGRLPNVHELLAIYAGRTSYGNNFNIDTDAYRSSVEYDSTFAWTVYFGDGNAYSYDKSYLNRKSRCVAG